MKNMKLEQRSRELSDSEKRVENSLKKVKRKEQIEKKGQRPYSSSTILLR